ncbi:unnamed protein product [Effrenium voratum]|nr:unnamed protein product [Effrenium voratum]
MLPEGCRSQRVKVRFTGTGRPDDLKLGVKSRRAWDEGTAPVWQKLWRKLSPAEKKAAEALGFTQPRWDEG